MMYPNIQTSKVLWNHPLVQTSIGYHRTERFFVLFIAFCLKIVHVRSLRNDSVMHTNVICTYVI